MFLAGDKWKDCLHMVNRLMMVNISQEPDTFCLKLHTSGVFSVKSMYSDLVNHGQPFHLKFIWKLKVPLKIEFFMWYLDRRVILTKENLQKRRRQGCTKCYFWGNEESIQHLFLDCPLAKLSWHTIHISFNLPTPTSSTNLFGNWLKGVHPKLKAQIRVGVCALLWAIWNCRNGCVFNMTKIPKKF